MSSEERRSSGAEGGGKIGKKVRVYFLGEGVSVRRRKGQTKERRVDL